MKSEENNQMHKHIKEKEIDINEKNFFSRRSFLGSVGLGAATMGLWTLACSPKATQSPQVIAGFDETIDESNLSEGWIPVSDRKIRVGLVGYGASKFSASFGFQDHPNVKIEAVSDLFPDRCAALAERVGCDKTYPSLEELVKDDNIEAVFVATDAPSHPRHCIEVLRHGKHVAVAVPVTYGSVEEGEQLLEEVKKNPGLKFMMFETSCFRQNLYEMRKIYEAGGFGDIVYSEGEYYHGSPLSVKPGEYKGVGSYNNWRQGGPPMWYPTHNTAYHIGITGGTFLEVSCYGTKRDDGSSTNQYNNPFNTEVALFRTSEGGISRQARSSATPGTASEIGRVRGTLGSYTDKYEGRMENLPDLKRPPLPPGVPAGGHGGSHGYLMNEFILSIMEDRKPLVDIIASMNMTIPGIIAHQSAMKDGELLKVPQYS